MKEVLEDMLPSPDIAIHGVSIVIRGFFNPSIFSPLWLRNQDLIGPDEYEESTIDIVSPDFSSFQAGWLRCQVSGDSFMVSTLDLDETERTRDVATGTLKALTHTPIAAVGINVDTHLVAKSLEAWHRIGNELTPKSNWSFLRDPGMKSVAMWGLRPDLYVGHIHVTVQPSSRIKYGVFIGHNDHFDLEEISELSTAHNSKAERPIEPTSEKLPVAIKILDEEWKASLRRADEAVKKIGRLADLG